MPYDIKKQGNKFAIIKRSTGKVVGHAKTRADAAASIRARMAGEHGWEPTQKK